MRRELLKGRSQICHDDLEISDLVVSADVCRSHQASASLGHTVECPRVVLDKQPVSQLAAVAVNRELLALIAFRIKVRDQFLREMIGPIIIRAVGQEDRDSRFGPRP